MTGSASTLGARLTGLLSPFPLFANVLAAFTHHLAGSAGATTFLSGVTAVSFAFGGFFLVIAALLTRLGPAPAYVLASAVAIALNGAALRRVRRGP